MNKIAGNFQNIGQVTGNFVNIPSTQKSSDEGNKDLFEKVLREKQESVIFSKHANLRLENRNIKLSDIQMQRLNSGVDQAREKKINESLIMVDNMSFIVNIKNNTVITALNNEDNQKVFTNIDGAVIS